MFTAAKHAIARLLNIEGLDIRLRRPPLRIHVSMPGVNVGIAYKTSEVCQAFRDANIPFIQPSVEFEPFLPKICATDHAQYIARTQQHGFVNYDFSDFLHHSYDNALCQVDMLFASKNGPYSQSHVYATIAQRKATGADLAPELKVMIELLT